MAESTSKIQKEEEIEYKSLIAESKYEELQKFIPQFAEFLEEYEQINHFFDTKDMQLDKEKITLRIRHKKGKYILTAKLNKAKKGQIFNTSDEINIMLTNEEAEMLLKEGKIPVDHIVFEQIEKETGIKIKKPARYLGQLTTFRKDYKRESDIISLDKNFYNGIVDYELEWETTNHVFVAQIKFLTGLQFGNASGKRKRFLKTLKQ